MGIDYMHAGMRVKFEVPGEPRAKGRPRFSNGHAYTPENTVEYENWVRLCFYEQCGSVRFPSDSALGMNVTAYYSIPSSVSQKKRLKMMSHEIRPTKKPDSSNVLKSIEDSLNQSIYHDDKQIVETKISRFYGEEPKVVVEIYEVGYEDPG